MCVLEEAAAHPCPNAEHGLPFKILCLKHGEFSLPQATDTHATYLFNIFSHGQVL